MIKTLRETKGFTLVELLVTLAILGIILSLSLFNITSWREHFDYKRMCDTAEILFDGANKKLTDFSASSYIDEYMLSVSGTNVRDDGSGTLYVYANSESLDTDGGRIIQSLCGDYIYDASVWQDGAYALKFTRKGKILGAFYSVKLKSFEGYNFEKSDFELENDSVGFYRVSY